MTAWAAGGSEDPTRVRPNKSGASGNWSLRESNGDADTELLSRLSNRLLDAGAAPAGHGSKLARVLGATSQSDDTQLPEDPVHRAVAEQVDQLLVWDRAVRADAYDAVHQMRVTTRKIRSLLRDAQESFGLTDDGDVGSRRTARTRRCLGCGARRRGARASATSGTGPAGAGAGAGPVRERLVEGAQRRYQNGLRRSLIAMRSQRYFRLLDALDAIVAESPRCRVGRGNAAGDHRHRL